MNISVLENSIIPYFKQQYPFPDTELKHVDIFQLTVAVILSAQCTDKRVNIITPPFFKRFKNYTDLARASQEEVFSYIKSCTYPNNKSKNLIGMAKMVIEEFNGKMPSDLALMQSIPGIGRKTANVIASVGFNQNTIAVDTHVFRVAQRIGLVTASKTPLEVENKLIKLIPENMRKDFHHWLILHGRSLCIARKPKCAECGIKTVCVFYKKSIG
jgi:endonuclease III